MVSKTKKSARRPTFLINFEWHASISIQSFLLARFLIVLFCCIDLFISDGKISGKIRAVDPPAGILGNGEPLCTSSPPRAYGAVSLLCTHKYFLPVPQFLTCLRIYIYSLFKSRGFGGFLEIGVIDSPVFPLRKWLTEGLIFSTILKYL